MAHQKLPPLNLPFVPLLPFYYLLPPGDKPSVCPHEEAIVIALKGKNEATLALTEADCYLPCGLLL